MMSENDQSDKEDISLEDAFNTMVRLTRNAKLTYNEHMVVERSVKVVHRALNKAPAPPSENMFTGSPDKESKPSS